MTKKITFLMLVVLMFAGINSFAQDAYLQNLTLSPYVKLNTPYQLNVNLLNNDGSNPLTTVSVSWQLDNGTVNTYGPFTISGGLPSGGYYVPLSLSPILNVTTAGKHTVKVWADATGEINRSNDTITDNIIALSTYAPKVTLLEEATAQWCEHCPPAGVVTDSLSNNPNIAVMRFHNGDNYSFSDEGTYYQNYFTEAGSGGFFPAGMVDMSEGGKYIVNDNYPNWPGDAESQGGISPLSLALTTTIDKTTRVVTVKLTANFKYAEAGNYSFNAYILENHIVDWQNDLNQNGTATFIIDSFVHNNVIRALMGGITGTQGIIPASPVANTNYTQTYTYTIPENWELNNISFVGTVFNTVNGYNQAVNSAKVNSIAEGITNVKVEDNLDAYPNPFTTGVTVSLPDNSSDVNVSIFSVDGKMVLNQQYGSVNGNLLYIDMENYNMTPGFYTLLVKTAGNAYSKKLIKF